jgi:protein CpxP
MKTLKLIFASLIISFGVNAQTGKMTKLEAGQKKTPEERAKFQTENMKKELSLTNDQYDKAYQINLGIVQKNQALQDQKMTAEERRNAVKSNNEARMSMLKEVLTAEQYLKMQEKLKERKSPEKE